MRQRISFPGTGEEQKIQRGVEPLPKRLTILLVEANDTLRNRVAQFLLHQGYEVRTANGSKDALAILVKEEIHLLLLDLMLPGRDGFTVLRHVRDERRGHFPYIIVMSATMTEEDQRKVRKLGGDDYLPKPFLLLHLFDRILEIEHRIRRGSSLYGRI